MKAAIDYLMVVNKISGNGNDIVKFSRFVDIKRMLVVWEADFYSMLSEFSVSNDGNDADEVY